MITSSSGNPPTFIVGRFSVGKYSYWSRLPEEGVAKGEAVQLEVQVNLSLGKFSYQSRLPEEGVAKGEAF